MKDLCLSVIIYLITLPVQGQIARYLERRDVDDGKNKNTMVLFVPSVSSNNSYLLASHFRLEMLDSKVKVNRTGTLLNLRNGRLEFMKKGQEMSLRGNIIQVQDYSFQEDSLQNPKPVTNKQSEEIFRTAYALDLETNRRIEYNKFPPPPRYNFSPLLPHVVKNKYYFLYSNAAPAFGMAKAIVVDEKLTIETSYHIYRHTGKVSSDSSMIYGLNNSTDFKTTEINIYDIRTDQQLLNLKVDFGIISVDLLSNGNLFCMMSDLRSVLMDQKGNVISKFSNGGYTACISGDEKTVLMASIYGDIRLYELTTGKLITETRDSYFVKANPKLPSSGKQIGFPTKISGGAFYIIPYSTGIMSLFSTKDNKVVANIFTDLEDWAVIAMDGRVDGTPGAFEKLEWREYDGDKLLKKTSIESTFQKYFTPRLLYSIIAGEPATELNEVRMDMQRVPNLQVDKINDQPLLTTLDQVPNYFSSNKNIKVTIKASDHNDQVTELRLYHNGKVIDVQVFNATGNYNFNVNLNSVYGPTNSIYAVASTQNGIESEKCKLIVNYSGESESVQPKLYVLIVGINKYQNPRYELNYALADAKAIESQLAGVKSGLFGSIEITSLFDTQATKTSIFQAFKTMSGVVKEQDIFLFYYAGHGTINEDVKGSEFYIAPQDVTQLYGNGAMLSEKAISASEIKKLSLSINAQKQIFILDACQSAGALGAAAVRGASEERAIGQLARSTGTYWLTAAGSDQFATEFKQLGHGVFTYSLLEAMQGNKNAAGVDGILTIRELSSYIEIRVPELSQQYKGKPQYPASYSFGNDFPILFGAQK
ncbi:hypothetical protein BH09BAC3_BH09BAC3_38390 [soil metagenome]